MGRLIGKVAIVTGAARGMGAAEAQRLAEEGASVIVADILDEEGARTAERIGKSAVYVHLDVSREDHWKHAVDTAITRFGRVDILVNNAGMCPEAPVMGITLDTFRKAIDVNLIGPLLGMQAVIPKMTEAGGGSIINIASINGLRGSVGMGAYAATKHGVLGMTKSVAMEVGQLGIRVNVVCPGPIRTAMMQQIVDISNTDISAAIAQHVPMRRLGEPEDMAGIVAFLASDDSKYCCGAEFVVDGGVIMGV